MRRLKYTVEMDVMALDGAQFPLAAEQLVKVAAFLERMPPAVLGMLPTGTITGEALPGWMAIIKIEEKED